MAGSRSCTPLPQGAWGGLQRAAGNQFDMYKTAKTARGHTSRTPINQNNAIKSSNPGAEDGSYSPGEELQQGQTSQSHDGRGQEGPSSKRRDVHGSNQHQEGARRTRGCKSLKINSLQQELGKERRLLMEQEKPRLKPSRTVCPREGNRTSSVAGSKSYKPLPQGV